MAVIHTTQARSCALAGECSGCPWIGQPYEQQLENKRHDLVTMLGANGFRPDEIPDVALLSVAPDGLRDRVDLTVQRQGSYRLGLYHLAQREVVHTGECPQMSPALAEWFKDFRRIELPIDRGSVRLRVGPGGERGVWLDLANVDVKALLDERQVLEQLMTMAHVEIGQRRKVLGRKAGALKLLDAEPRPWFATYLGTELSSQPLLCSIGDFTQPSMAANRILVAEVMRLVLQSGLSRVAEFGSGIGNFTLPLAFALKGVDAYEIDANACANLEENLAQARLTQKVTIQRGDFQNLREHRRPDFSEIDGIVVDPPRAGLKGFLDPLVALPAEDRPRHIYYISCFAESFSQDCRRLNELGYGFSALTILDQFPQSSHYEIIAQLNWGGA